MKYNIIGILIASLFVFSSCKDAIDITQVGELDAERVFLNTADLKLGLLGAYNKFD